MDSARARSGPVRIIASRHDHAINDNLNKRLARSEFMRSRPSCWRKMRAAYSKSRRQSYAGALMTITCGVRPNGAPRIPAVVHVDGTARPQIVRDEDNSAVRRILRRFRDVTNCRSDQHQLQRARGPIVNRPEECLQALQTGGSISFVNAAGGVREGVSYF